MKTKIVTLGALVAAVAAGYFLGGMKPAVNTTENMGSAEPDVLYWVAPMDSEFRREKPGKSPMGMDLVPVYSSEESAAENSVSIDPAIAQNLGVRTAMAEIQPWTQRINAVGQVVWDGGKVTKVFARAEGWLEAFSIESVGQQVAKGQSLFGIYAPQLVTAQQEFVSALKSGNRMLVKNSRMRLLALGASATQVKEIERSKRVQRLLPYVAERDGVVTALAAAEGSYVTSKTEIATIAGTEQVWVEAEVHESDIAAVNVGDTVTVSLTAFPDKQLQATLAYIYPTLNPMTRTAKVRVVLPNVQSLLRAGMFARLQLLSEQAPALHIPREAVIRARAGNRVVVAMGGGQFVVKPVLLGAESDTVSTVLEGLEAGDKVVTSAQFLLDSEANGYQALERLTSLRNAEGRATIMGFPQRGSVRLLHEPIASIGWPAMNMVFTVADNVSLMPFNKEDQVSFVIRETLAGEWEITAIEPLLQQQHSASEPPASEMNHGGMNHD